jgi:uncharacterized membrane protein
LVPFGTPGVFAFLQAGAIAAPESTSIAGAVEAGVGWVRLAADVAGAAIVALGIVFALIGFVRALSVRQAAAFTDVRLTLGRYLALALEFQLGADILSTAIAPSWDQIGKLGAVAVIRTALNFFLTRELRDAGQRVSSTSQRSDGVVDPTGQ